MRVLIADDDDSMRELLSEVLHAQGYHVLAAADGREALTLALTHPLDACVLDVQMPHMSGIDVRDHLKASRERLPVVLMSGDPAYFELPNLVEKPFDPEVLLALLMRLRDAPRA